MVSERSNDTLETSNMFVTAKRVGSYTGADARDIDMITQETDNHRPDAKQQHNKLVNGKMGVSSELSDTGAREIDRGCEKMETDCINGQANICEGGFEKEDIKNTCATINAVEPTKLYAAVDQNVSYMVPDALNVGMTTKRSSPKKITAREKLELLECGWALRMIQTKWEAKDFMSPVNWKLLNLPDYPDIIKRPMDLRTIETKLNEGAYSNAIEFSSDMEVVLSNALQYNNPNSGIWSAAKTLQTIWKQKFHDFKKSSVVDPKDNSILRMSLDSPSSDLSAGLPLKFHQTQTLMRIEKGKAVLGG